MPHIDRNHPQRVKYAGAHGGGVVVTLPYDPRTGICTGCKKDVEKDEIQNTAFHHWVYSYQPKTVKENPELAIENTGEYCFSCHQVADGIRAMLFANTIRVVDVMKTLPSEQRDKLLKILKETVSFWDEQEEGHNIMIKRIKDSLSIE